MLDYDQPLYRPPSEAYSLILQISIGCSWNKCSFCEMYTSKKFKIRPQQEIFNEIEAVSRYSPEIKKIFLADANAMVLSFDKMLTLLEKLNSHFPKLNRISAYARAKDLENKSLEELIILKEKGLKLLYVGIESGDQEVLNNINKGEDVAQSTLCLQKAQKAGIKLSVMIINGLAGKQLSKQHALNSAIEINKIQPEFLSTLVLSFPYGEENFTKRYKGEFTALNTIELIAEMKIFIENLNLESTIFRSDHASNYLVLKGIMGRDKDNLLYDINKVLDSPENAKLRPEYLRGL